MPLNEKQKIVANTIDKNIFLVAPAGTGKTNTLSERVYNIIDKKIAKEEEILCITFTNKAAKEMKERIESKMGGVVKATIKTFHSFCLEIVRNNVKKNTDIPVDFVIFDEEDTKEIVKKIATIQFSKAFNIKNIDINMLQMFINLVKDYRIQFGFIYGTEDEDYRKTINNLQAIHNQKLCDCFKKDGSIKKLLMMHILKFGEKYISFYNKALRADKGLDFNDIVTVTKILFEDKSIVEHYRKKYKVINIDEVQDTSLADYEVIEKLFKNDKDKNILMCGDIFQTIYKWRGSNPDEIFARFKKECKPIEIAFDKNYRSTKLLTKASMKFLTNIFDTKVSDIYVDGMNSYSEEEGGKIKLIEYNSIEAEAIGILNTVKSLHKNGANLNKTCILTRSNNYNKDISKTLKPFLYNLDFDFILVDEYKFFRRAEIKDIIAIFKILIDASDSISLERVIKRLNTGIGKVILEKMKTREFRSARIKLSDLIDEKTSKGEFYTELLTSYENEGNIVVFDVESTGTNVTEDEIIQIAAITIDNKGNIVDTYERFLRPRKSVGKSSRVHGFTDEFLQNNGNDKIEILKEFRAYTKDKLIIGHNVQYDINIFTSELDRNNIGGPLFKGFYDTLDIYRRFYPTLENHKLEYLSELFSTKHKPSHNALDDIKATYELLIMAIEQKIKPTSFQRMALIADLYRNFDEFRSKYNNLKEKSYELRPFEIILEIQKSFNLLAKYPIDEQENRFGKIAEFHRILSALDETEKSPRDALISAVDITGLSSGEVEELLANKDKHPRIPIITVHQAKGLEFENVIVSGLIEGLFPIYRGELDEEGKLFYVAITRAKKNLILTYPNERINKNSHYKTKLSHFVEAIGAEFLELEKK
ncbi:MAG: ATP-dependent helicase [Sarcina sp.]